MKIKRIVTFGVVVLAVLFSYSMQAVAKDSEKVKVDVCHLDSPSDEKGKVLSVSVNAVQAHIKHGDPVDFTKYEDGSCKKYVKPVGSGSRSLR